MLFIFICTGAVILFVTMVCVLLFVLYSIIIGVFLCAGDVILLLQQHGLGEKSSRILESGSICEQAIWKAVSLLWIVTMVWQAVNPFKKQQQPTELISSQEYHEQSTKSGGDCNILKETCSLKKKQLFRRCRAAAKRIGRPIKIVKSWIPDKSSKKLATR